MRHEDSLKIVGDKVLLVPYRREHVEKYHHWMSDPELLRLTGSERLTLQEEFDMQRTWTQDLNKCTFIILNRDEYEKTNDEIQSMVGDTNLYLDQDQNQNQLDEDQGVGIGIQTAEIEIMIAEISARRKGFARESLQLMMNFGQEKLSLRRFVAKIKDDNQTSINLFESLGYKFSCKSEIFHEITLLWDGSS